MAKDRPIASDHAVPAAGRFARLRAAVTNLPGRLRRNPLRSLLTLAGLSAAIVGIYLAWPLAFPEPRTGNYSQDLAEALNRLDAGDFQQARLLAGQLGGRKALTYSQRGGPLFIQGAITLAEAQQQLDPAKRRILSLIAARSLEEARDCGWPRGRQAQGLQLLARALHDGGRHLDSLPVMRQALAADPEARQVLLPLLTDCCLRQNPPRLEEALAYSDQYLQLQLSSEDRHRGLLIRSGILLDQKRFTEAWQAAAGIAEPSPEHAAAVVAKGRIAIAAWQSGQTISAASPVTPATLIEVLKSGLGKKGLSLEDAGPMELLLGMALEHLPDVEAAARQYHRVHNTYFGRPEAMAAELFHAGLLLDERPAESVRLFVHALSEAAQGGPAPREWLSPTNLEQRIQTALDRLLAGGNYSLALALAQASGPAVSEVEGLFDQIVTHRAWAEKLEGDAREQPLQQADITRAEARIQWREAGNKGRRLAELRFATRHYLTDLRDCARCYFRGQNYAEASRAYRLLLEQASRSDRPESLLGLGESLFALGDIPAALTAFTSCLDENPQHPATYRARLLASLALLEQGQSNQAKELLLDNLYRQALTPQSDEWRDSLFAYGFLLYREGLTLETMSRQSGVDQPDPDARRAGLARLEQSHDAFQLAARVLKEAVERYPAAAEAIRARYAIAESFRHSAKWPRKRLGTITIETTRVALNRQLQEELQESLSHYATLISTLADGKEADKTPTDLAILRNSYFSRADVLFDLGRYQEAVQAYSAATNRYQHEPAALEAYVQIAACQRRLNRVTEARGTLEQARIVLQRLRPDADYTSTTRYSREEWTQLLAWLRTL